MILIFGGAYQGKLDFALEKTGLTMDKVYHCTTELDLSYPIINDLQEYLLQLIKNGETPSLLFPSLLDKLEGKAVIVQDISSGVVPLDPTLRLWREEVGRVLVLLSRRADSVYRVFCGIPMQIKPV